MGTMSGECRLIHGNFSFLPQAEKNRLDAPPSGLASPLEPPPSTARIEKTSQILPIPINPHLGKRPRTLPTRFPRASRPRRPPDAPPVSLRTIFSPSCLLPRACSGWATVHRPLAPCGASIVHFGLRFRATSQRVSSAAYDVPRPFNAVYTVADFPPHVC